MSILEERNWDSLRKRHHAFWNCAPVDRPLIFVTHKHYVDTELVAAAFGSGELFPGSIDARPLLEEYSQAADMREKIGDDALAVAEPLLGIPWLEAICGCRVEIANEKSIWPSSPENSGSIEKIEFDPNNPWLKKLLEVIQTVVEHAAGRYPVSLSHLRGPADILIALLGTEPFFYKFFEAPDLIRELASQVAQVWRGVAKAQLPLLPSFRGGYAIRQFGIWSEERSSWLQDDTSVMISQPQYQDLFLDGFQKMCMFPYGTLHLHIPSLHHAETFAEVPGVRAMNFYFDSQKISLNDAIPTLEKLQKAQMPLILAKDVNEGFTLDEYDHIIDKLSPRGLSVHVCSENVEEGRHVMAHVRKQARR